MVNPNQEQIYEQNRFRLNRVNLHYRQMFIAYIGFSGLLFAMAVLAPLMVSRNRSIDGTNIFYVSMATGLIQVLSAVIVLVTGFFISAKSGLAILFQGIALIALLVLSLMGIGALAKPNILFSIVGLVLAGYSTHLYFEYSDLKKLPGFPLFSMRAENHAEYVPPLNVLANRPSEEMEDISIGGAAQPSVPFPMPEQGVPDAARSEEVMLSEMSSDILTSRNSVILPPPVDLNLNSLEGVQPAEQPDSAPVLPTLSAEAMLAEMDSGERTPNGKGVLPDPEEVKMRLRRMREEQKQLSQSAEAEKTEADGQSLSF